MSDSKMNVRELIAALALASSDLDSKVRCTVKSGNNLVTFTVVSVQDVSTETEPGFVNIHIDDPHAWDAETFDELPMGVLTLE